MRLTCPLVGRSTWTVVLSATLVVACSGDTGESVDLTATTSTAAATTTEVTTSTEPVPATSAATTIVVDTTVVDTTVVDTTVVDTSTTAGPTSTVADEPGPEVWETLDALSGSWLAFTSVRTGRGELFAIDVDSGVERRLTDLGGDVYQPAWSPDGTAIAFQCPSKQQPADTDSGVGASDICSLALATGEVTYLTDDAAGDQSPVWSPDSTTVAFLTVGDDGVAQVRSVDVAGGEPVVVAEGGAPDWSPDGSELAVTGLGGAVTVVDVASGDARLLAESGTLSADPAWSPNGSEIAFGCATGEAGPDDIVPPTGICVIAADGSAQRTLADPGAYSSDPAWSPDGSAIVFTNTDYSIGLSDVVVARVAAGEPRSIGPGFSPVWSPDGTQIAMIVPEAGIQLIDFESGAASVVSVDPSTGDLTWAPTG